MSARPLSHPPVRLAGLQRLAVYASAALLLLSGGVWLAVHSMTGASTEPESGLHTAESWCLRMHGAAAMASLLAVGSLLPGHVAQAWRLRRNHRSGLPMLVLVGLLVPTAYGLYYAGGEDSRHWLSLVHWSLGLAAAACLPLHVWLGRRHQRRQRHR